MHPGSLMGENDTFGAKCSEFLASGTWPQLSDELLHAFLVEAEATVNSCWKAVWIQRNHFHRVLFWPWRLLSCDHCPENLSRRIFMFDEDRKESSISQTNSGHVAAVNTSTISNSIGNGIHSTETPKRAMWYSLQMTIFQDVSGHWPWSRNHWPVETHERWIGLKGQG